MGTFREVSLAKARERRKIARELLADGKDPSDAKRAKKAESEAASLSAVESIGLALLTLNTAGWSDSHYVREERNLRKDVFPYLGKRAIGSIEQTELLKVIRKVEERGALDVAHRVLLTSRGV